MHGAGESQSAIVQPVHEWTIGFKHLTEANGLHERPLSQHHSLSYGRLYDMLSAVQEEQACLWAPNACQLPSNKNANPVTQSFGLLHAVSGHHNSCCLPCIADHIPQHAPRRRV